MISFWKATGDFARSFHCQVQKICQDTAGPLFIEDGVVVISNEKSASVYKSSPPGRKTSYPDR